VQEATNDNRQNTDHGHQLTGQLLGQEQKPHNEKDIRLIKIKHWKTRQREHEYKYRINVQFLDKEQACGAQFHCTVLDMEQSENMWKGYADEKFLTFYTSLLKIY
jgi:hypothetical protein